MHWWRVSTWCRHCFTFFRWLDSVISASLSEVCSRKQMQTLLLKASVDQLIQQTDNISLVELPYNRDTTSFWIFLTFLFRNRWLAGDFCLLYLHQTEKCGHCWESTDLDTAELMQLYTFDTLPDVVSVMTPTSHLLTTGLITTFSLREIYFEVPFLKSANGHDCNCYWYLERCKKMPPVKIYGGHLI